MVRTDTRKGGQLRGGIRHQPIQLLIEFGDFFGELLVERRATERSANFVAICTSLGVAPGRKQAQVSTRLLVGSLRRRWRRSSGALTSRACSWFAACVRAFTAD